MIKKIVIAAFLLLQITIANGVEIVNWDTSGDGGTTWDGWNYSTDVQDNSANHTGFYEDGAASYTSCSRVPRVMEKYDYGQSCDFYIDTTFYAPSSSGGGSLKVYDDGTGSVNQASFWFFWQDNWYDRGFADADSDRMDFYIYIDGMEDPDFEDLPNYNYHVGAYLADEGSECDVGGDGEGPGNRKYYYNMVLKSGAWIHAVLSDHPERIRDDSSSMALPIDEMFADMANIYFEVRFEQSGLTTVWFDEWNVYQTSQNENNISIDGLWVGYWSADDLWYIGWQDPYTIEQYGGGSYSTFQIRYSTSPITNDNWSSATQIEPEVNEYGTTNNVRPPDNWKRSNGTYFYLPDAVEENSVLYFAIKDVSETANGDAHNGDDYTAQTYITTVDYALSASSVTLTCYLDADGDGYSDGTSETDVETCSTDYYEASELTATSGDCDDSNAAINPGAYDYCGDGIDQDCSGADAVCSSYPIPMFDARLVGGMLFD